MCVFRGVISTYGRTNVAVGTRKVEVLNSIRMKITDKENDVNDIFANISVALATITSVLIELQ